jgi:hypothetical protein
MSSVAETPVDPLRIVTALIEMGHVGTVYRDVYLERADWPLVKRLAPRTQALREPVEGKQKLIETARDVYAVRDVSLDPFSPGRRPGQCHIHVRGFKKQGNINTPLELAILNQTDSFSLAIDALDRMPRYRVAGSSVREALLDEQIACKGHAYEHGWIPPTSRTSSGRSRKGTTMSAPEAALPRTTTASDAMAALRQQYGCGRPSIGPWWAMAARPSTRSASGRPSSPTPSISRHSVMASSSAPWRRDSRRSL